MNCNYFVQDNRDNPFSYSPIPVHADLSQQGGWMKRMKKGGCSLISTAPLDVNQNISEIFIFHYANSFVGMFFFVKRAEAQNTCTHQCQSDQRQKSWSLWLLRLETVSSQSLCCNVVSFLSGRICLVELFTRRNQVPPDFLHSHPWLIGSWFMWQILLLALRETALTGLTDL